MYRVCKTFRDQSKCVSELAEACIALKKKLGYSDQDARTVSLENITAVARSSQMTLNLLDSWHKGDEAVRQVIPQLLGLKTVTPDAVQMAGDFLNKSSKLALILLAQFQIENALRNVARELGLPNAGNGFYRCASAVLSYLAIPDDRMQFLNTAARLRNSLHANGIHRRQYPNEQSLVTIRGIEYEFIDGQYISCASWEHIAHVLEESIGILEEVFDSPLVRAIADPMFEQYAWEQETKL